MYPFMTPKRIKNAELTELPMMPPIEPYLSNLSDTAAAVAATTIEVTMTILEMLVDKYQG